jgi:sugar O-acyltransferase (sialic acid O-acetyltransferase NeuD family)
MDRPLAIFGAGTLARLACLAALDSGREVLAFVVDDEFLGPPTFMERPLLSWAAARQQLPRAETSMFCAIGYRRMKARDSAYRRALQAGFELTSLVTAGAHCSRHAVIGPNCFVMDGAVVEPGARLGVNNIIWSNATVCHDCVVGDHNFIAANATLGGHVQIGDRNFIGFGAVVRERQRMGDDCLLAAQSLLLQDAHHGRYVGAPARRVAQIDPDIGVELA